ncbi:MAG: UDP-glucose 4-epimerase GalE [Pseudomonadota bacterium]
MARNIIVTGGAGYIGSHVCVELLSGGDNVLIVDDFSNSHPEAVERVKAITDRDATCLHADLARFEDRERIFAAVDAFAPDAAIHLAGLKAVGESVAEPQRYYHVNLNSALTLIAALKRAGAKKLVFSSSATVYGDLNPNPVDENGRLGPTNPYGRTKFMIEQVLRDVARAADWGVVSLRYFNPVGAHSSGQIGEDPNDIPNNLFPYIAQVAVGRREKLSVFGNDYPTPDGTGVRDYIHVVDLARGHVSALGYLDKAPTGVEDINLGAGRGYSVLEAIAAFKRASNRDIPYEFAPRRDGDIAEIVADASKAKNLIGWRAEKSLDDMCADHWRWQSQNPNGYAES